MAKDHEEIAEDERDEEDALDDEEDTGDEDESDEDESDEEEGAEDDEDDESDSDDEAPLPKSRKELDKLVADAVAKATRRPNAARRTSKNGNDQRSRTGKPDPKVDELSQTVATMQRNEEKRQFGYANGLAPDEVDVVFKLRKNPTAKSLKDPIIQGALDGYRNAKRLKDNTPRAGGAGRPTRQAARDEKNMTPEEKQNRFTDRRNQILAGQKR